MVTQSRCKLQQLWLDFSHWDKWLAAGRRPRLLMIDVELLIEVEPPSSPDPSSESKVYIDWLLCWALIRSSSHSSRDIFLFCQLKNETQTDFTIYNIYCDDWWPIRTESTQIILVTVDVDRIVCQGSTLSRITSTQLYLFSSFGLPAPVLQPDTQGTLQIWICGWILLHFDVRTISLA